MNIVNIALVIFSAAIILLLFLIWLTAGRRRKCRKCRNCRHYAEHYITAFNGQGLFRFGYCQWQVNDTRMVEPDIARECPSFEKGGGS